ncbi:MAG: 4-amino-4-deoxy-L-arabinose transferase-like glycosyltransferase [Planctomycetota bacterium]|jgi:4-amino-4-deoxy-L-arabinose transferase-like glycosyltransferase
MDSNTPHANISELEVPTIAGNDSRWDRRAYGMLALSLVLLIAGAFRVGPTFDEHFYIASGYSYWQTGDFALNREHPPLVKLLASLPLLLDSEVKWSEHATELLDFPRAWFFQQNARHWWTMLFLARLPMCLLITGLGYLVYRTARRLFSARAAFFALACFALNPNILAHGRLAALDGGLTVFLFLAVLCFAQLMTAFSWKHLTLAGIAFGLANLAKFTSLALVPFFAATSVIIAIRERKLTPIAHLLGASLIGLGVFCAGYGFEARSFSEVRQLEAYVQQEPVREGAPASNFFNNSVLNGLVGTLFGEDRRVPVLTALKGVDYQLQHGSDGHGSYFRGEPLPVGTAFDGGNPHPEFYAFTWAVKNPISFSFLMLLGLGAVFRYRSKLGFARMFLFVGFPIALFLMFSFGNALMGIKYILPIFPFVALWIAAAVHSFPRLGAIVASIAVIEGSILLPETSATHPHELMYYNVAAGGPVGGPWTTVIGDDWGQDAFMMGEFRFRNAAFIKDAGGLFYDPYTRADLANIQLMDLTRNFEQPKGIVAVNAINYYRDAARYEWLREYEPFLRIGWSIYVYDTRVPAPGGDPLEAWRREHDQQVLNNK